METIDIRKATMDHLPRLAELFNQYRIFYGKEPDSKSAEQFLADRIAHNDSEIFISFSSTTITGFMQLYPLFSSTRMKKLWLLNDLFVVEKFRGQGFSIALINKAKELCMLSDACGFMLETAKTNNIGNKLYQNMGLKHDTEHNVYNWEVK
jgi:GNAT superfamily N-acetyltransferase